MNRANEITYYDELGVTRNAAPEEIRDAFRALVRLLHPDHQTDEQLKIIAESQMRKINRIYAVLSDGERRRRYDDSLDESRRTPTIVFSPGSNVNVQRLMARFAWAGAVLITVVVLVWLAAEAPSAPPIQTSAERSTPAKNAAPADAPGVVAQLRAELNLMKSERDLANREIARLRGLKDFGRPVHEKSGDTESSPPPPPASTTITELPAPARFVPAPAVAPAAVRPPPLTRNSPAPPPPRTIAGFWFYARPTQGQHNKNTMLYPPEFIEATLSEQNGIVHGRYRSRYQIVDRAISPDVSFEFTGSPNGTNLACPWSGPGGARGELTLKMTGDNSMEIEWTASELGSLQALVSGTAKLTRRVD